MLRTAWGLSKEVRKNIRPLDGSQSIELSPKSLLLRFGGVRNGRFYATQSRVFPSVIEQSWISIALLTTHLLFKWRELEGRSLKSLCTNVFYTSRLATQAYEVTSAAVSDGVGEALTIASGQTASNLLWKSRFILSKAIDRDI